MSKPHAFVRLIALAHSVTIVALLSTSVQADHLDLNATPTNRGVPEKEQTPMPEPSETLPSSSRSPTPETFQNSLTPSALDIEPYFVDRASFVNVIRERKSLALLNFWQGKSARIYIGVGPTGLAGINLTQNRKPRPRMSDSSSPDYTKLIEALTEEYQTTSE